jgi:aspartyl protease family protein
VVNDNSYPQIKHWAALSDGNHHAEEFCVRHPLIVLLLFAIAVALGLLVARGTDAGTVGSASTGVAALVVKLAALLILGSAVLTLFRKRFSQALEVSMFWVIVALLLAVGYNYRSDLPEFANRVLAEIVPNRAVSNGRSVEIARGHSGDFPIAIEVNGARVATVLDTGASEVVLTHEAAKAAGLPLEVLAYTVNVDTANGRGRAASVTLDRIAIGAIVERSVPALVVQPGQLKTSLLGMSFLNRLESWEVRGDKLSLRGYP